jgi:hypothetical protein
MTHEEDPSVERIQPFDSAEFPLARQHGTAGRNEIRATTRRVMPSRQSKKQIERSNQPRQPKTGGTGNHPRQHTRKSGGKS